jgi:3-oxoacyl-[acyl-carrier-protein] synthase III
MEVLEKVYYWWVIQYLETCSKEDKSTYPLFGDAGTATALEYSPECVTFKFQYGVDGSGSKAIIIPDGAFRNPFSSGSLNKETFEEGVTRAPQNLILEGMDVFSFGINKAPASVNALIEHFDIDKEKIDFFLFHQANYFMNEKIRKKLNIPAEKVPYSLNKYGNTSSATIPLTMVTELSEVLKKSSIEILACGFGVGLSWGSVFLKINQITCSSLIEI